MVVVVEVVDEVVDDEVVVGNWVVVVDDSVVEVSSGREADEEPPQLERSNALRARARSGVRKFIEAESNGDLRVVWSARIRS